MIETTTRSVGLPPIFAACCDDGGPCERPWIDGRRTYATDGRIAVRALVEDVDREAIREAMKRTGWNMPPVAYWFSRWRPGALSLALPEGLEAMRPCPRCKADADRAMSCLECAGEGAIWNRARVRLAPGLSLMAYRVARLVECGVRVVRQGDGPRAPVRFEVGPAEGLLVPLVEEAR